MQRRDARNIRAAVADDTQLQLDQKLSATPRFAHSSCNGLVVS